MSDLSDLISPIGAWRKSCVFRFIVTLFSQGYGLVSIGERKGIDIRGAWGLCEEGRRKAFQGGEESDHKGLGHLVLRQWLWLEENEMRNVGT